MSSKKKSYKIHEKILNQNIADAIQSLSSKDISEFLQILYTASKNSREILLIECGYYSASIGYLLAVMLIVDLIDQEELVQKIDNFMICSASTGQLEVLKFLVGKFPHHKALCVVSVAKTNCLEFLVNNAFINSSTMECLLSMGTDARICKIFKKLQNFGLFLPDDICSLCAKEEMWKCLEYALEQGKKWESVTSSQLLSYKKWSISQLQELNLELPNDICNSCAKEEM
jgi:hypothetical protein